MLGLASVTYDLAVTSTLLGVPRLPGWYLGVQHWADGLSTAYFALLAPAAISCLGLAILRTRTMPAWTGYVLLAAAVLLLGQYAAFRGALPFPQFLAFIAIGIAALARPTPPPPPRSQAGEPAGTAPGGDPFDNLAVYVSRLRPDGKTDRLWTVDLDAEHWEAFRIKNPGKPSKDFS